MLVSLCANGRKFCEDYEHNPNWVPKTRPYKHYYVGNINNGDLYLPENIYETFELGTKYDFVIRTVGEELITRFTGWYDKTDDGENYIHLVTDLIEEKL